MRGQQTTITYIIVLGLEAIRAFSVGVLFLKEGSSLPKSAGMARILAGLSRAAN
jgi:hypothetical protein